MLLDAFFYRNKVELFAVATVYGDAPGALNRGRVPFRCRPQLNRRSCGRGHERLKFLRRGAPRQDRRPMRLLARRTGPISDDFVHLPLKRSCRRNSPVLQFCLQQCHDFRIVLGLPEHLLKFRNAVIEVRSKRHHLNPHVKISLSVLFDHRMSAAAPNHARLQLVLVAPLRGQGGQAQRQFVTFSRFFHIGLEAGVHDFRVLPLTYSTPSAKLRLLNKELANVHR